MNVKPPPPTLKEIPDAETVKANIIAAMRTSILPVTAEWLEQHILTNYQYKLSEAAALYGFASIEEMLFEIAGIEACELPGRTNFKLTSSGDDAQRPLPIVHHSPAISTSNVSSVQRSLPIVHHSPAIVTPKVQQQRVPPPDINGPSRRFTGTAAILRNKSKATSQHVSPVKMEENVPIEKYFIEQTIKSNGGTMYFDVLKYHYFMQTGRHLDLGKLNEIMKTHAGDLGTAQQEKIKFTLHKNQFIVKFGTQHAPAHYDEWNRLLESVLDAPNQKLLITEDYLKEAGFEWTQEEFINVISINEVLKEMFQFSLGDGSPVLSLVQT